MTQNNRETPARIMQLAEKLRQAKTYEEGAPHLWMLRSLLETYTGPMPISLKEELSPLMVFYPPRDCLTGKWRDEERMAALKSPDK